MKRSPLNQLFHELRHWKTDAVIPKLFVLEKKMINSDDWELRYNEMPHPCQVIVKSVNELHRYGSFGIGYDDTVGWFILVTQGQGPVLVWCEGHRSNSPQYLEQR